MKKILIYHDATSKVVDDTPTCQDFCDLCGDCLHCYPESCSRTEDGQHVWIEYCSGTDREYTPQEISLDNVLKERVKQDEKWGEQNHNDSDWLSILTEEVGEAAQAINHDKFGGPAAGTLNQELIQIAAVAVAWLECIERRKK